MIRPFSQLVVLTSRFHWPKNGAEASSTIATDAVCGSLMEQDSSKAGRTACRSCAIFRKMRSEPPLGAHKKPRNRIEKPIEKLCKPSERIGEKMLIDGLQSAALQHSGRKHPWPAGDWRAGIWRRPSALCFP